MSNNGSSPLVLWYNQLGMNDVDRVGGKNASLGEMITNLSGMGVSVPNGFATTADAFNLFLDQSGVNQRIYDLLDKTDIDDVTELAKAGAQIRQWIIDTPFQPELEKAIHDAYNQLSALGIGKSYDCFHVLFTFIWQGNFVLYIFRFTGK